METSTQKTIAMGELTVIAKDVRTYMDTAESFEISDDEHVGMVGDFVKKLLFRRKKHEDKRLSLVAPLKKVAKDIDEMFAAPRKELDAVVIVCKEKLKKYATMQMKIEDARRKREIDEAAQAKREADEAAEALAELSAPMAEVVTKQADKAVTEAAKPAKVVAQKGNESTVAVVKKWKARVVDLQALAAGVGEGAIPVECISFKQSELDKMARDLEQEMTLSGVEFYLDISTVVR